MKIRVVVGRRVRPAFGVRFATKLPNASNESGLGLDTTDFYASLLVGQDHAVRPPGRQHRHRHPGRPDNGNRQNDVLTYGVSLARAVTQAAEIVGEVNGRVNLAATGRFRGPRAADCCGSAAATRAARSGWTPRSCSA